MHVLRSASRTEIDPALFDHPHKAIGDSDGVAAYVGVVQLWPGVGECWLKPGPMFYHKRLALIRFLPVFIEAMMSNYGLHRIHAHVAPQHVRFSHLLGFTEEGTLVGHGPNGEDHIMMRFVGVH